MEKLIKTGRLAGLALMGAVMLVVYFVALYKLQIIEGEAYYEESRNSIVTTQVVQAARGNIYDRYGRVLVSNRECINIQFDDNNFFYGGYVDDHNATILDMVRMIETSGKNYADDLPVTASPPFEYTAMTGAQEEMLKAYLAERKLSESTTAVELMSYFRDRYNIDNNYSADEMRIIAGVRYSINARYTDGFATAPYIFVEDAPTSLISALLEKYGSVLSEERSFVREYKTQYASHILGYIGLMDSKEYEKYKTTADYSMDAKVGKDGAELAFETYLHGVDGEKTIISTSEGVVINEFYNVQPEPGGHAYLTFDIQLQEKVERALEAGIGRLQAARDQDNLAAVAMGAPDKVREDIQGGGIVVVDVKSGEPLALASYPTFDLATLMDTYNEVLARDNNPLFNRATMGTYAPGSTFKPVTAIAALTEVEAMSRGTEIGAINTETRIKCEGVFTRYADQGYAPECWIYSQKMLHGNENVTDAVRDSCNYYFYTIAHDLGVDLMGEYAHNFGLGVSTGIELVETIGNMANQANHYDYAGQDWVIGDTLQAGIGQSDSLFTPLQLAEYCATLANGGTRHSASMLKTVRSYDFSEKIFEREDEALSTVESPSYNFTAVQQGMHLATIDPSNLMYQDFFGYKMKVAAKTGTAQLGEEKTNNAIFICYAPFDDPEIAIAIVVERGGSGSSLGAIARDVLDAYFTEVDVSHVQETENSLLK